MELKEISKKIIKVINNYKKKYNIKTDQDYYILKLQEEIGELTQAYISLTNRGRKRQKTKEEIKENFSHELADVIGMLILLANEHNIDIEQAIESKWFQYL